MASYDLSGPADRDLTSIFVYSIRQFGEPTAISYLTGLHDCFGRLADNRQLGRSIDALRKGYFRFEHASHVIFYRRHERGVRIMRVLHQRQDPDRHL
jgi:toxin ParE1/3/4